MFVMFILCQCLSYLSHINFYLTSMFVRLISRQCLSCLSHVNVCHAYLTSMFIMFISRQCLPCLSHVPDMVIKLHPTGLPLLLPLDVLGPMLMKAWWSMVEEYTTLRFLRIIPLSRRICPCNMPENHQEGEVALSMFQKKCSSPCSCVVCGHC